MSDWMKSIKNMFSGSRKIQPTSVPSNTTARKVDFGVTNVPQTKVISFPGLEDKAVSEKVALEKLRAQKDEFQEVPKQIQEEPVTDVDQRYQRLDCKASLRQLELSKDDILAGQVLVLYEKKLIELRMKKKQYTGGQFILTNYKLIFRPTSKDHNPERDNYFKVPLGFIDRIEKRNQNKKNESHPKLVLTFKDGREFKFKFHVVEMLKRISDEMHKFAFVTHKRHFFAFRHFQANPQIEERFKGWQLYDYERELARLNIKPMPHSEKLTTQFTSDFKFFDNRDGKLCSTYPRLLVVPARLSHDYVVRCARFRSRQRLPTLVYGIEVERGKFVTMYRCSQPKVGVSKNRCIEDQMMLRLIGDPRSEIKDQFKGKPNCKIYDARSYIAAMGNMVAGKGYQLVEFYKNCQIQWLDIPNIHGVREAYLKMQAASRGQDSKFVSAVSDSGWYDMIFGIISGARGIANTMLKGINVLIHCSDGWDRTAQLTSITQIILDPYYRTLQGFMVLTQKEFISLGHQFCERLGQGMNRPDNEQKSPVFIQWLDCISQLLSQFPLSFQFNQRLLSQIARKCLSNQYGTFLCDSQLQQLKTFVPSRTTSLWSYVRQNAELFLNPYYQPTWSRYLDVSYAQKNVRIWKEHFLYYTDGWRDPYSIYSCAWGDQNPAVIHAQKKKQNMLLKDKHAQNQKTIKLLQSQIQKLKQQKRKKNAS